MGRDFFTFPGIFVRLTITSFKKVLLNCFDIFRLIENGAVYENVKSNDDSSIATEKQVVSSQCKVCQKNFTESTIFKHISHRPSCKAGYSPDEIEYFENRNRRKKIKKLNDSYDPAERKAKYQKEKEMR